jgi:predicted transcriptional regulator of viral defense system
VKKNKDSNYSIDQEVIRNYIETISKINEPMKKIKKELEKSMEPIKEISKQIQKSMEPIKELSRQISSISNVYSEQLKVSSDVIKKIMKQNNGYMTTRMIEPLNINRNYLSILEKAKEIERVTRGIYMTPDTIEDNYYIFQLKYNKAIFSHMNALYFHNLTQEIPYTYTVTIPNSYHIDEINKKHTAFYVNDEIYELGITETKTPMGNKVRSYDVERCICDIIRSKKRMDIEHVKYSVKEYLKRNDKDLIKLSDYAEKMGIKEEVMDFVSIMYE